MYRSVVLGTMSFVIGCCSSLSAQCANCGTSYTTGPYETYSNYPVEGQMLEGDVIQGDVIQGEIIGQTFDGMFGNYAMESYPVEIQGQMLGDVTFPESYSNANYPSASFATTHQTQSYMNQRIPAQTVSYNAAASMSLDHVLSVVNQKRRQRGLYALQLDANLTAVAQQKSMNRARRRITGHDNLPKGGAAVEGVGYAHGHSDLCSRFNTCYLYSTGYRRAGAAISYDRSGRAYYTLLLR